METTSGGDYRAKLLSSHVSSAIAQAELDVRTNQPADAYQRCVILLHWTI
jgi:hypothetical protein